MAGSFGLGEVDVTALGSTVGHAAKRSSGSIWLDGPTPLKARNGLRRGHACETAEPQQDSGPTGGQVVCRAAAVWAPSNLLKAKVDGWGWKLWPWLG